MPGKTELKVYFLSSISNIPSFIIWGLVAVLVVGCTILALRKGLREGLRACTVIMLVEWLFLILCSAVIFRDVRVEREYNLIPFDSYYHIPEDSYFIEATAVNVLNVILFIPVGVLLGVAKGANEKRKTKNEITWLWVVLIGFEISFLIELLQFLFKRGLFETDDLIHNVVGCLLGFALYRITLKLIRYVQTLFQTLV